MLRARLTRIVLLAAVGLLAAAGPAFAADGVGLWGRTDDKVITYWGFALMGLFAVIVVGLSIIQGRLENRKEREREELERLRRD